MYQLSNGQFTARLSADALTAVNICLQQLQQKRGIAFSSQSEALQVLCSDWLNQQTAENNSIQPTAPVQLPENAVVLAPNEYIIEMNPLTEERIEKVRQLAGDDLSPSEPIKNVLDYALMATIDIKNMVAYDSPALDALDSFSGSDPVLSGKHYNALVLDAVRRATESPKEVQRPLADHEVLIELSPAQHQTLLKINENRREKIEEWNENNERQMAHETPATTMRNSFFNRAQLYNWSGEFYTGFNDDETPE